MSNFLHDAANDNRPMIIPQCFLSKTAKLKMSMLSQIFPFIFKTKKSYSDLPASAFSSGLTKREQHELLITHLKDN